jgi:hypothetical protein
MQAEPPVAVLELFPEERMYLREVLRGLTPQKWRAPTSSPGWSVKDIVAHIIGDDFNNLSGGRDGFRDAWFEWSQWDELVAFINARNEAWVDALRGLSPRVLVELLEFAGERTQAYYGSLELMGMGPNVA